MEYDLNSEQTEKILQFQDLTSIEDLTFCRDALVRHNWDLEAAVQDQLNIKEGRPSVFASDNNPPAVVNDISRQDVYSPENERRIEPWSWYYGGPFGFATSLIFRFLYDTVTSLVRIVRLIFSPPRKYPLTDPVGDVLRHIDNFKANYGDQHPVFYQGTYGQAVNDAKNELRFLVIHLHSEDVPDSVNFCRDVLTNRETIAFINENNILLWSCSINCGEGQRVNDVIRCSVYPFVAVILYKEGRMVIVARLQGATTASTFLDRLATVILNNGPTLISARAERMERSINQSLRVQQDEAYMASLLADQMKQQKRMEEEARKQFAEEEKVRKVEDDRRKKEEIEKTKLEVARKVPPEPKNNEEDIVSIVFKIPSGRRLERKFLSSHTLQDIYNFIFGLPELSTQFEISTNFPKRVLQCNNSSESLKDAGLGSREVLFIYDLEA